MHRGLGAVLACSGKVEAVRNEETPGQTPPLSDANNIRAMLTIEHGPGKSHVQLYIFLSNKCRQWVVPLGRFTNFASETIMEQPDDDDDEARGDLGS